MTKNDARARSDRSSGGKVKTGAKVVAERLEKARKQQRLRSPTIQRAIKIVEAFLREKGRVLYGGKAINDQLPRAARFYDPAVDIPDYDLYSPRPRSDAILLANRLHDAEIPFVEVKPSIHEGTFKVFADFVPVADITYMPEELYRKLKREAVRSSGGARLWLASPDWLRIGMFLELSRPRGDTSRWPKVFERLRLLNEHKPFRTARGDCDAASPSSAIAATAPRPDVQLALAEAAQFVAKHGNVLVGATANNVYVKALALAASGEGKKPHQQRPGSWKLPLGGPDQPDFDVLSTSAQAHAEQLASQLRKLSGVAGRDVSVRRVPGAGEVLPEAWRVSVAGHTIIDFLQAEACYAYHKVGKVRVGSIATLLSLWFAALFAPREDQLLLPDRSRLLCAIQMLMWVAEQRAEGTKVGAASPLFKTFVEACHGKQTQLEDIMARRWIKRPRGGADDKATTTAAGMIDEDQIAPLMYRPERGRLNSRSSK